LLRVVALAWQELYWNNLSKECFPFFLFGQWVAHWSNPDDWPGVKGQWPTPAFGGKRQAASSKQQAASEGSGWQQGGSMVETLPEHGRCCFVVLLGWQPLTDGICDDVLDVVEGIAGETVIDLSQDEREDYRKIWLRQENVYLRKNQKDVTHWVIGCAKKHCRWDNNENDARGSRDSQKIWSSQRNVYLRRN
jgi:hypothetical protein